MTAYDDGDERDFHGKDSLEGEYIGLYEANSSPAPLSVDDVTLSDLVPRLWDKDTTYSGRNTDSGSHFGGDI